MNLSQQYEESHKQGKHTVEKMQCREDMLIQTLHHMYDDLQDTIPRCKIQEQETHGNPQDKSCTRAKRIDCNRRQHGVEFGKRADAIQHTLC